MGKLSKHYLSRDYTKMKKLVEELLEDYERSREKYGDTERIIELGEKLERLGKKLNKLKLIIKEK